MYEGKDEKFGLKNKGQQQVCIHSVQIQVETIMKTTDQIISGLQIL